MDWVWQPVEVERQEHLCQEEVEGAEGLILEEVAEEDQGGEEQVVEAVVEVVAWQQNY